jgi:hypothetical protein
LIDDWVSRLQRLNDHVQDSYSDDRLGDRETRRRLLTQWVGPIRRLTRLTGQPLEQVLQGRPLVGVDGSINTFGGQFPYYVDLLRALAKPSQGRPVVLKDMHCPLPPDDEIDEAIAIRNDNEIRQRKLATLEVQVALAAIDEVHPLLILMDGPLVRFAMRTKDSFAILREKVLKENILLVGCIENIESKVINSVMGDALPSGWVHRYDRDLLWDTLDYGEALAVGRPAKGLSREHTEGDQAAPIRTWFMRSSLEQGVVGVDMLEEQAGEFPWVADYLFTLSPPDGRGIPIWLDLVDKEVRLTHVELEAYLDLLSPGVKRVFKSKRDQRFF